MICHNKRDVNTLQSSQPVHGRTGTRSLAEVFRHVFVKRNFALLAALTWGFMLGECLLATAGTLGLARLGVPFVGLAAFNVGLLGITVGIFWPLARHFYFREMEPKAVGPVLPVLFFVGATCLAAVLPIVLGVFSVQTWQENQKNRAGRASKRKKMAASKSLWRSVPDRMASAFNKMAHC